MIPFKKSAAVALLLSVFMPYSANNTWAATRHLSTTVPMCAGITLTANYLAESTPGEGAGFFFRIENKTSKEIVLERPVPSSAHWYARVGNRWLWRASAGTGGALINALAEKGPMFAFRPQTPPEHPEYLTVPAHGHIEFQELMKDHPAIAYRPSCVMCNYPGEYQYRAVFAYAYLPHPEEHKSNLLTCGLRSEPVGMPPLSPLAASNGAKKE